MKQGTEIRIDAGKQEEMKAGAGTEGPDVRGQGSVKCG
jgi:hypothetical protein